MAQSGTTDLGSNFGSGGGGGGGVTSLNSLTGALSLVGGPGITITPSGAIITISSTDLPTAVISINGDTTANQTLTTGTAGTDFAILDNGTGDHKFNLPTASAVNRGALSSTDWTTFNNKQTALTFGSISTSTTGVTVVNGANSTVGPNVTVNIQNATTSQNGLLTSTDWNTFNNKQAAGNYITALTGDGTATGPGSAVFTLASVNANVGQFAVSTANAKGLVTSATNLTGDATSSGAALTLATVNGNVGSFGSSTSIPSFTVNAKGLITAASGNAVIAPAGTLTGTTLNSTVVNSSLTSVGTITSGTWNGTTIDVAHGGTSNTTAASARGPTGLNIDQRSTFSNAPYTVLSTDRYVAQVGTMSASRTVTLPAANSVNPGQQLIIIDESGTVSTTNTISVVPAGGDTIDNSAAPFLLRTAYGRAVLYSNGTNNWTEPIVGITRGGTGLTTIPTNGQLLIGDTTNGTYDLNTITAGTGILITNAPGSITISSNATSAQTTKTANYTILSTDATIFVDSSGGAFTLTLPNPATIAGKMYRIIDSTGFMDTNNITLARFSAEKIEGIAASKVLQTAWGWFQVTTNGTDWFVG